MNNFDKLTFLLKNPRGIIRILGEKGLLNWVSDNLYLKVVFWSETGEILHLNIPRTYNEKIQWLKLYYRKPEFSNYVDKYEVRTYIKETIGEHYLIPIIDIFDNVEEIDWDSLPNKFVLKCTHGSGSNIICTDKDKLDIESMNCKLRKWMRRNWYWFGREWPYKNVKPRIICEKYMVDETGTQLKDYKIFCFNGEPKVIEVDYNRFVQHKRNLYDTKWNYISASIKYPNDPNEIIQKPENLETMLQLARILAKEYPHIRIDFYSINGKIYFGEMTFYHDAGFGRFQPEEFAIEMGSFIKLPINN